MKFTCSIAMDNAAFHENPLELARILDRITLRIEQEGMHPCDTQPILDVNGNRVGSWRIFDDD